ncbi:iduronate sulfatase [Salpingoeca rosetta]|uniref:Iduronate sulfatase n=1 Tax=Salpingoeca rosetta (strain ATCC 50818 / BSB-021) TaxID=946362 RepID=F2UI38_SALR5|nr:iduronate sulfatase [Salpingoeca rosetta]EGD76787.1 iduronate sulfatase [Salpingoeca rosetta]|eukprot:XP_004991159.1 iduronate sulfatase [Salpingoeca rosetta]
MALLPVLALILVAVVDAAEVCHGTPADRLPNILHLVADDMRPQLGAYGHEYMITPNIDALAQRSLLFDFAYTQFAYCAPSRNSFMSGRRPDRTRALNFLTTFREAPGGKNWTAMPQFFKKQGYFTSAAGKVYHDGMDDPPSWSYPSNQTKWIECQPGDIHDPHFNYCGVTKDSLIQYTDEDLALTEGLKRMELAHQSGKPWWVSIGVHRPHTPYRVPAGFYGSELYPFDVAPPKHRYPPQNVPYMAGNWADGDINDPAHGCPSCVVPDERSVEYRKWYYAAVTWTDHSLGRAIRKLEELGVENNTIIVFHSDHGYQLGELNEWSKKTDTELAVHVPFMVRVPWKQNSIGKRTKVRAELVDLYRTLADLAGLGDHVEDGVQGTSLAGAFDDPDAPPHKLQTKLAYSQIGRCACALFPKYNVTQCDANACAHVPLPAFDFMGYTMRTGDYRFTAWVPFDNTTMRVDWNRTAAYELYDLTADTGRDFDFDGFSVNLANNASYATLVGNFSQQLQHAVNTWD